VISLPFYPLDNARMEWVYVNKGVRKITIGHKYHNKKWGGGKKKRKEKKREDITTIGNKRK
jgi:hypothetical protein